MIREEQNSFILETKHTSYVFRVLPTGHLEHLYYGRRLHLEMEDCKPEVTGIGAMSEKCIFAPGNSVVYSAEHSDLCLENRLLEMSSYGKGDIREPFVELIHADGGTTCDFLYAGAEIDQERITQGDMPGSYSEDGKYEHLKVILKDAKYDLIMELHYLVYEECDVITRMTRLINESQEKVYIKRLMSNQVDFDRNQYVMTTFTGGWAREMKRTDTPVLSGKYVNASFTGTSSNRANSFVMLSDRNTSEDFGGCYGFHLVYSGNHYECAEVNAHGKTRFVAGINPQNFLWRLNPGEIFDAPEAAMTFSHEGYNGMSQHMHAFIREHIVRGNWKHKDRPILLNSWEAAYFDIDEKKLLKLAKAGKQVGIELFVMDDGWFGNRNNDQSSLGDWDVNAKKLPGGLKGLADKINDLGLDFGIWVEPEMVCVDSDLYRSHPQWAMQLPDSNHSEGRNQRLLDLANPEVQDFIIEKMTEVFSSANIAYVKWDMNRIMSDLYSPYIASISDKEDANLRQLETVHRYQLGLYRCLTALNERFPNILFEGCCSGGNRFDPAMLCYFPQIWASDDTDAVCRAEIQTNYSYGYPMSVVSAHVSACPNHQTLRNTPLLTRYNVARFGVLGYECNLCDMKKEDLDDIAEQIRRYKDQRVLLQWGNFYRGRRSSDGQSAYLSGSVLSQMPGNITEWTCVSADRKMAAGMVMQNLVVPNQSYECYYAKGLCAEGLYEFSGEQFATNLKNFGDLVNTVAPIHVKQDSLVHNVIAKYVKMNGESEHYYVHGDVLMYAGVKLSQAYNGCGYTDGVRYFQDFNSRVYLMRRIDAEK